MNSHAHTYLFVHTNNGIHNGSSLTPVLHLFSYTFLLIQFGPAVSWCSLQPQEWPLQGFEITCQIIPISWCTYRPQQWHTYFQYLSHYNQRQLNASRDTDATCKGLMVRLYIMFRRGYMLCSSDSIITAQVIGYHISDLLFSSFLISHAWKIQPCIAWHFRLN